MAVALDRERWWDWERVNALSADEQEARRLVEHEQAQEVERLIRSRVSLLHVRDEKTATELMDLGRKLRAAARRVADTATNEAWLGAKQAGRL